MSERCNNSACFSVEIKGTSDICVTFVVYACGKSILGVRTHEKDTADRRQRHLYMVSENILTAPGLPGEKAPTFHKLLFVYAEDTSAEVLRAAMLQKGFDLILVSSIWEAKRRIFEDKEIELILCDLELPDGTAMELFHTLRRVAGMFQMKNPPVRLLPFFILTENNDLATEYEYRHEGVNDYITAPVNIPELIRRVLFFVE